MSQRAVFIRVDGDFAKEKLLEIFGYKEESENSNQMIIRLSSALGARRNNSYIPRGSQHVLIVGNHLLLVVCVKIVLTLVHMDVLVERKMKINQSIII